ncbi:hypothetical protein SKAU_G00408020 [Synaphobranchus kaupii]|uniref:Uncharacterized protein n=1 Tax=Synaphobranchus kaupii TaxID=118154 RepID=A0A9Q1EAC6_SYNKA|nr:hypothetical protein SKAU_G00408020 [Synaphobranchus kaupii]
MLLKQAVMKERAIIRPMMEDVRLEKNKVMKSLSDLDQRLLDLKTLQTKLNSEMRGAILRIRDALLKRAVSLAVEVQELCGSEERSILERREVLKKLEERQVYLLAFAKRTGAYSGECSELLSYRRKIQQQLQDVMSSDVSPRPSMVTAAFCCDSEIYSKIDTFGTLVVETVPFACENGKGKQPHPPHKIQAPIGQGVLTAQTPPTSSPNLSAVSSSAQIPPTSCQTPPTSCQTPPTSCQTPPTSCQILPIYPQKPPTFSQIPHTPNQIPPTSYQTPPTPSQTPPNPSQKPPTSCKIPPTFSQIPPAFSQIPPTSSQIPPTFFYIHPMPSQAPPTSYSKAQLSLFLPLHPKPLVPSKLNAKSSTLSQPHSVSPSPSQIGPLPLFVNKCPAYFPPYQPKYIGGPPSYAPPPPGHLSPVNLPHSLPVALRSSPYHPTPNGQTASAKAPAFRAAANGPCGRTSPTVSQVAFLPGAQGMDESAVFNAVAGLIHPTVGKTSTGCRLARERAPPAGDKREERVECRPASDVVGTDNAEPSKEVMVKMQEMAGVLQFPSVPVAAASVPALAYQHPLLTVQRRFLERITPPPSAKPIKKETCRPAPNRPSEQSAAGEGLSQASDRVDTAERGQSQSPNGIGPTGCNTGASAYLKDMQQGSCPSAAQTDPDEPPQRSPHRFTNRLSVFSRFRPPAANRLSGFGWVIPTAVCQVFEPAKIAKSRPDWP